MVANQPIERPDSSDFIVNKLNSIQRQAGESSRQSKYPFIVSHPDPNTQASVPDLQIIPDLNDPNGGSRVILGTGSGGTVLDTAYSLLYGGKVASMYDLSGNVMWRQDELVGYGISHPSMQGMLSPDFSGQGINSFGTGAETSVAFGEFFAYNPAMRIGVLLRTGSGGAFNWRFSLTHSAGTVFGPLTSSAGGNVYLNQTLLFPGSAMSTMVSSSLLITNTAVSQTIQISPMRCYGVSAAQYYVDNGLPIPR